MIANAYPHLATRVRLTNAFAQLCPVSAEPQPGSTISISYAAEALLLETKALRRYLDSFTGENPHGVRDLEEAVQLIAQHCAAALGAPVDVTAHYLLATGEMDVEVHAEPALSGTLQK